MKFLIKEISNSKTEIRVSLAPTENNNLSYKIVLLTSGINYSKYYKANIIY